MEALPKKNLLRYLQIYASISENGVEDHVKDIQAN